MKVFLADIIGFPLDNPPSWEEYLAFDPYRTGLTRPMWMQGQKKYFGVKTTEIKELLLTSNCIELNDSKRICQN